MAIVKGDAYGHGTVELSRAVIKGGASWLGVARFSEARILRQGGIRAPIWVMGMAAPDDVDETIPNNVTLTLHGLETLQLFSTRARAAHQTALAHLKVDTGMGRLGVFAEEFFSLHVSCKRQAESIWTACTAFWQQLKIRIHLTK